MLKSQIWKTIPRFFLLSPASTRGRRAQFLFNDGADFPLALALRTKRGATVGEVFSFLSNLYFRGKLAYAQAFAREAAAATFVITPDRGLIPPDTRVTLDDLHQFAASPIELANAAYREPLLDAARQLSRTGHETCEAVLLGSIATGKYIDVLLSVFEERLLFPQEFVGRGDMSRGGLLLRCVDARSELSYIPVAGAIRRGQRPPRLTPR